jgi:hypothetical protein
MQPVGRVEQSETRHFLTRAPTARINLLLCKTMDSGRWSSCRQIYQAMFDRTAMHIFVVFHEAIVSGFAWLYPTYRLSVLSINKILISTNLVLGLLLYKYQYILN